VRRSCGDGMSFSPVEVGSIITSIATLIGVIIALVKLHLDQQKFTKEMELSKKEMELSKQYLKNLSQLVESHIRSQTSQQQIEREKLNWQQLKDIGKALWEYATSEEEE